MILFVDLGNSRIKWAREEEGQWKIGSTLPTHQSNLRAVLVDTWSVLPQAQRVVACNVAGDAPFQALESASEELWQQPVERFQATAECAGVRNGYRDPGALGSDRWAALIGARHQFQGAVCVIDCGTAVTVDALTADGEFLGGAIFPGLTLLRTELAHGTAGAGAPPGRDDACLGRETADAVAAGLRFGLVGAIERIVDEHRKILGSNMRVVITGGDVVSLIPLLRFDATLVPDLVLRGLAVAEGVC